MFDRVLGESAFRDLMQSWASSLDKGEPPSVTELKRYFMAASEPEYTYCLLKYLEGPPSEEGVLAALYIHELECSESARKAASHFCLRCMEHGEKLHLLVLLMFSRLEELPNAMRKAVVRGLDSSWIALRVAAASGGVKFTEDLDPLVFRSLPILNSELANEVPAIRIMAAVGLAQCRVRIKEFSPRLLALLETESPSFQMYVITRMNAAYGDEDQLVNFLIESGCNSENDLSIRSCIFRMLGHICPTRKDVQQVLLKRLGIETDWELQLGAGLGLVNQQLKFPDKAVSLLLKRFQSRDTDARVALATILHGAASFIRVKHLTELASNLETEADDVVREKLLRCIANAGPDAIDVAMQSAKSGPTLLRTLWSGILSELCSRFPDEFTDAYQRHADARLDELMPSILSWADRFSNAFVDAVRHALKSENEIERHNALLAIRNVGKSAAAATTELVDIYLYGSSDEQRLAESVLLRFAEATHAYLRTYDHDRIRGHDKLLRFQHLQRLLGISESSIRDIELVRVDDIQSIRIFVAIAELIERDGPISGRKLSELLEDRQVRGELALDLPTSDVSIRRKIKILETRLALFLPDSERVQLLSGREKQARMLTEAGRDWLPRCKAFLRTFDGED